jgi:hypothetical protein
MRLRSTLRVSVSTRTLRVRIGMSRVMRWWSSGVGTARSRCRRMNRLPYRRGDDIAAYTYRADIYCPACLIEATIADGLAAPAARDMPTDDVLEQCAGALAIDRDDDTTYDTGEFPKPVFLDWLTSDEACTRCHQRL